MRLKPRRERVDREAVLYLTPREPEADPSEEREEGMFFVVARHAGGSNMSAAGKFSPVHFDKELTPRPREVAAKLAAGDRDKLADRRRESKRAELERERVGQIGLVRGEIRHGTRHDTPTRAGLQPQDVAWLTDALPSA